MKKRDRRSFLRDAFGLSLLAPLRIEAGTVVTPFPEDPKPRTQSALRIRQDAAKYQCIQPAAEQISNSDEITLRHYIGSYKKGLPQDQVGIVDSNAYGTLLRALSTGQHADFEKITCGSGMKLVNPEAGFMYEMEGADSHRFACPPAPSLTSRQAAGEMVELYWQALARDVSFTDYHRSPVIRATTRELSKLASFAGPKGLDGTVSADTVFRGPFEGCLKGPYVSQFLLKPVPINSTWVEQRYRVPQPGVDFLTQRSEWLQLQGGLPPYREMVFDSTPRYISTGRHLAEWVHFDFLYQAFHNAALILLNLGPESILNTNPYYARTSPYKKSRVQTGFATFGGPQICSWLGRVATAALGASWYQKWCVHRRLRPEEFGGLVHHTLSGSMQCPIDSELLESDAVKRVFERNQTYLLPQAYQEGCPLHPAYPAGHATVAGACSVVLKAFFDEEGLVTDCVVPNDEGTSLVRYEGPALTVGGEVNKLAFNIAIARNFAGIHYRSDAMAGFRLGEDVAIAKLQDLVNTLTEDFEGFRFTRLDGISVHIRKQSYSPKSMEGKG
jgi:hypothetical protein